MDQFSSVPPVIPTAINNSGKGKQKFVAGFIIIVLLIIISVLFLSKSKVPSSDGSNLTEAERQAVMDSLAKSAASAPKMTEAERQAVMDSLAKSAASAPKMTEAERQAAMDLLSKSANGQ